MTTRIRRRLRWTIAAVKRVAPRGGGLPDDVWNHRHRAILTVLGILMAGLPLFALARGFELVHAFADVLPSAGMALGSMLVRNRRWKASLATLGLVVTAASYIHLSGGTTEAHFLIFVLIGLITLYQDWVPFTLAVGGVTAHHAVIGLSAPEDVFNTPAAAHSPVPWALIHGAFVLAAAVTNAAAWKAAENQALRDALSGLPNRRAFTAGLHAAVATGDSAAVLFMDLTGFKKVNDSMGHAAGDEILREVGRRLAAAIRRPDLAARFGGDEFVVVLPGASVADATDVASRLIDAVRAPFAVGGRQLRLSVAIGITRGTGCAETLVHEADSAMYVAKRQWPNGGFEVFEPSMVTMEMAMSTSEQGLQHEATTTSRQRDELAASLTPAPRVPFA